MFLEDFVDWLFMKGITPSMIMLTLMMLLFSGFILHWELSTKPDLENKCSLNFGDYEIDFCVQNYEGIIGCSKINATLIRTEKHLFSSSKYICSREGEVIPI